MTTDASLFSPVRVERLDDAAIPLERSRLLLKLPPDDLALLLPLLETMELASGCVLAEPNEPLTHAYFPESCVVSLVSRMRDGSTAEVGTVGDEGVVGLPLFLGVNASLSLTVVQVPGAARRMSATAFVDALRSIPSLDTWYACSRTGT